MVQAHLGGALQAPLRVETRLFGLARDAVLAGRQGLRVTSVHLAHLDVGRRGCALLSRSGAATVVLVVTPGLALALVRFPARFYIFRLDGQVDGTEAVLLVQRLVDEALPARVTSERGLLVRGLHDCRRHQKLLAAFEPLVARVSRARLLKRVVLLGESADEHGTCLLGECDRLRSVRAPCSCRFDQVIDQRARLGQVVQLVGALRRLLLRRLLETLLRRRR